MDSPPGQPRPTATLAELYARQGLLGRAREIYQQLAQGDDAAAAQAARRKLEELGPSAARRIGALEELLRAVTGGGAGREHPMSFRDDLEGICGRVEGSFGASLMGFDGIAIETVEPKQTDGLELQTLLIEYSGILSQIRTAAEQLQMGNASEVSIRTEKLVAIARLLTPEYFMVLALSPEGNVGRARYELRVQGPKVAAQL